ncbi:glycosyltransferase family 2 protein [Streptomyces sp. KR80]|uniref:glycosyltransferase family 2 protein n=1 Tax=Streptomyces sp. KR80 TaxID=3457426 RepID=UPI003FD61C6D
MARTTPDVTVIVIVYNDAERLVRAVASLRRQTLRNIEIIISDDHSTDRSPEVARALAAEDDRISYLRLPVNSGGCSAPRNAAIERARAPYLMFLDSDDELPEDACRMLLETLLADDCLDFAMGAVERVRADTGSVGSWHPGLFSEQRTVHGIEEQPELMFDHLATNKMYRRRFMDQHQLRFPLGIHYEDQLFSAQAYCLANSFAIIPEPVYRWHISPYEAEATLSISNQRHRIENVRDRVHVARLVDDFLLENGYQRIKADKDHKFLKHDLRMYTGDLPHRTPEWIRQFTEETSPYLDTLAPEAFARLPRDQRVCIQLLRSERFEEAQLAARGLGRNVGPREVVEDGTGRLFWGSELPADPSAACELDVTEALRSRPFHRALLRHEITRIEPLSDSRLGLHVRTYDAGRQLPMGPVAATVQLATSRRRLRTSFRLDLVRPGLYEGTVTLDLSAVPLALHGFSGARHPVLTITRYRRHNTGPLLAPLAFPTVHQRIAHCVGEHLITVEPEGKGAGRLQVVWQRAGLLARAEPHLPVVRGVIGPHLSVARALTRGLVR